MTAHDPTVLPDDLPVPVDDGAAAHLAGSAVPDLELPATTGVGVNLAERCAHGPVVVFAYPRTGRPGVEPLVPNWNDIPGARGCTPEACGFRDLAAVFAEAGAGLYGLSTQDTGYQQEAVARLRLTYPLLSDERLAFTDALRPPTFTAGLGDGADERAERDAMIRRLAGLPRRQRAAVVLRFYAGLSDAEIATQLGCRVTTVRSQISRALATLRVDLTARPHTFQEAT